MTDGAPRVSVILPVHNGTGLLARAVISVLRQGYGDLELVIVDDASTEDVRSVVASFCDDRVRYVRREAQGGPAAARNTGIQCARGELLAFQDADDEWLLDKLGRQVALIDTTPELPDLVCCGLIRWHPTHVYHYAPPASVHDPLRWIENDCKAFCQTWLVRRDAVLRVNGFDEGLPVWEDWDLLRRIARRRRPVLTPEPLVLSYADGGGISSSLALRVRSLERLQPKLAAEPGTAALAARIAYLLGWFRIHQGDMSGARRAFARTWRSPRHAARAALLGIVSLLGGGLVRRLLSPPQGG